MREIDTIWVHCSATKASMDIGVEEIRKWHKDRGWSDIGYHYVIRRDGTIEPGRSEDQVGAHVVNYNKGSLGICLVGGIGENLQPDANFTLKQYNSLYTLIKDLNFKYNKNLRVRGHREVANKACPCFSIGDLLSYV